jgi:4-azaleucine resistance transporter AzlC
MQWWPRSSTERIAFRNGVNDLIPAAPGIVAWGLVTGVAMVKSGLTVAQAVGMTFTVFAGSAQLSALPLMAAAAPVWVIFVTALVVNLRFVIYSAAIRLEFVHLSWPGKLLIGYLTGDIVFVKFMERLQRDPLFPHKDWTLLGSSLTNWLAWQLGSCIGIFAAAFIPTHWGLELAGTLALLALLIPQCLGHRAWKPTLVGACVAGCVAVIAYSLPMKLGLLLGVVCGITAALLTEPREPPVHAYRQEAR